MKLSTEDRREIEDTLIRYCHAIADRDAAVSASAFIENGVLEIAWTGTLGPATRIEGRPAIERWARDAMSYLAAMHYMRVWLGNVLVEASGEDQATARAFFMAVGHDGETESTGTFVCRFRRTDGTWRLSLLRSVIDGTREETAARESLLVARMKKGNRGASATEASGPGSGPKNHRPNVRRAIR